MTRQHLPFLAAGVLLTGLCGFSGAAMAAAPEKHVLVIASQGKDPYSLVLEGFKKSMAAGGRRISYEIIHLDRESSAAPDGVTGGSGRKVDLCLALGSSALKAVADAGIEAPVVSALTLRGSAAATGQGIAAGVDLEFSHERQLELLSKALPQVKVVGVLYNPAENGTYIAEATAAAAGMGLKILPLRVDRPRDIPKALEAAARRADALWGIPDSVVMGPLTAREIILFSFRNRIPLAGLSPAWAKAGALYAPAWDYRDIGRQCAGFAETLLGGMPAGKSTFTGPEKMLYVVNAKVAEKLRITLDPAFTSNAVELY
jgi:putative ABC transport system substrate-binding protein